MRILVVEDDAMIADGIRAGLSLAGASIDCVSGCEDARAALAANEFSAVVLDIMLPDGSGVDLLRAIRAAGDTTPVLLLTALDETPDRIAGLDAGADDYLGKPFDLDELSARLRAIIRRRDGRAATCLEHGPVRLYPAEGNATLDGVSVALSRREFAVLHALMERPGVVRSRAELEERLYGWGDEVDSNAIEVHIHNLRAKLGRSAIETMRGLGYRMAPR
ncbi:DNA-binding response regulator [Rhodopseudomonas sp. WA056]|jgi:DNA-binding response OmpR family regulator|uniref:Two component transcriptional regulator, winged helix family n=1 Tax=Rhodopseudomonas palustris (strain DX-1) TaxID=652103 RepID=E6VGZ0_RHOPX|nr:MULTISPECIES: response regulator transcription factor [Rhodopseudomonas]NEW89744.1 DNA-binding response regulator [Rhodopseudomonas sp. WA056]QDL99258.1 response regulator transcription factor [Rhodopseudomonas palustris]